MKQQPIGLAIIGTGYMASRYLSVLGAQSGLAPVALLSTPRSIPEATGLAEKYRIPKTTTDIDELIDDERVEAIIVCSPPGAHRDQVVRSLRGNLAVLCEKPLGVVLEDLEEIRDVASSTGGLVQVGMNCRYRQQYAVPQRLVASGSLGEPRLIRGTYVYNSVDSARRGSKPWSLASAADPYPFLFGGAIHVVDLMRWVGGPVAEVQATGRGFELRAEMGFDTITATLIFTSGAIGELTVGASAYRPNEIGLEIWCSLGSVVGDHVYRRDGHTTSDSSDVLDIEQGPSDLLRQLSDFAGAIGEPREPMNSVEEAIANFDVLTAIADACLSERNIGVSHHWQRPILPTGRGPT